MELKGKKYIESIATTKLVFPKAEAKSLIKAFVKEDEAKSYKEIGKHILEHYYGESKHFNIDEVISAIKEVDAEWHPPIVEIVVEK